ncbi:MAG: hypothetical protein AAF961_08620 [Planctomycetota bacterium]
MYSQRFARFSSDPHEVRRIPDVGRELRHGPNLPALRYQLNSGWQFRRRRRPVHAICRQRRTEYGDVDFDSAAVDRSINSSEPRIDERQDADVTRTTQRWVDSDANDALTFIRGHRDKEDGWSVNSSGVATVACRPRLSVEHSTDAVLQVHKFPQGRNGCSGATDELRISSGGDARS